MLACEGLPYAFASFDITSRMDGDAVKTLASPIPRKGEIPAEDDVVDAAIEVTAGLRHFDSCENAELFGAEDAAEAANRVCYIEDCRVRRELRELKKLRISIVEYLNTAPLVWGFTDGPLAGKYDLSFHVPSQCAESLRRGDVDIAIIPSIEYQHIDNVVAIPGMAIAAKGEVRSLLVVSQRPIQRAKKIALDTSSRATQALGADSVRRALGHQSGICAGSARSRGDVAHGGCGAGDWRSGAAHRDENGSAGCEDAARSRSGEEPCCQGDPEEMPVPGFETVFVYDVAFQWRELTGKPCVLAIWAGRPEAITPEAIADFEASKRYGIERVREIAEALQSNWTCRRGRSSAT